MIHAISLPGGETVYYDAGRNRLMRNCDAHLSLDGKLNVKEKYTPREMSCFWENCFEQIALSVTEACNLRCDYCVYHEKYDGNSPLQNMSFDTAKNAIDFFLEHSGDSLTRHISFYGGEPLLRFDLIRECVAYAKRKCIGVNLTFGITSNGILLENEDIAAFLAENDFAVLVSLDGPGHVHDRYRKDIDGEGTYARIIENLRRLRRKYPEFYDANISFNAVIAPPYEQDILNDFFYNEQAVFQAGLVNRTPFFDECVQNCIKIPKEKAYQSYDIHIKSFRENAHYRRSVLKEYRQIHAIACSSGNGAALNEAVVPHSTCLPGIKKLLVRANGDAMVCEKVDERNPIFCLGNVNEGLEMGQAGSLLSTYNRIRAEKCKSCWAIRLCKLCYAYFADNGDVPESFCSQTRAEAEARFAFYISEIAANRKFVRELEML